MTTRYINTASTPGGNGTTNATSGANRAYASHAEWEAAEQSALSEDHIVWFEGASADTTKVAIDGWTPGSYKIILRTDPTATYGRHQGAYSTSKARLETTLSAFADYSLQILEDNVEVYGYQFGTSTSGSASDAAAISVSTSGGSAVAGARIESCFIAKLSGTAGPCQGIRVWVTGSSAKIGKNFLVDWRNATTNWWAGFSYGNAPNVWLYRNTAINCYYGYYCNNTSITLKQNIAQSCTDGYSGTPNSASDRNCSDITSDAPGTNPVTGTVTFVGSGDYHLSASDTVARDAGADLSGDAYYPLSADFEDQTITGTPDLGADEYSAPAGDTALAGIARAVVSASAALLTGIALVGSLAASTTVVADLTTAIQPDSAAIVRATIAGDLSTDIPFGSVSPARAIIAGDIATSIPLAAWVVADAQTDADLSTAIHFVSTATARATVSASFDALAADFLSSIHVRANTVAELGTIIHLSSFGFSSAFANALLSDYHRTGIPSTLNSVRILPNHNSVRILPNHNSVRIVNG